MQFRRLGSVAAACATITLACSASASAAAPPAAAPADCAHTFTVAAHRDYAKRVFQRATISRDAKHRLAKMRHCQVQGGKALRATHRTERRLKRWRALYHCTQSKVVNCIRDATRVYGGSFAHNVACARSESGLSVYARNGSGATGLFQFMPSTFSSTLARMGVGAKSIYSAKWQARAAAWKFSHDGFGEWSGAGC
ncbi:transglycosylase SLT domain-containing protein [Solirubrobacter soli]|uniref:transglycosylase SLT domain-containing protein n=1 Tax=Solirubrobacter soli TaxID=363832 RepID=UPI0004028DFB|nr:transglycosylase SLT domain-containing protein [Solirubrobacter soli]